ncbi:MAG TPA: prepilin-type N-terminal cleavage/methylation domain-containing protein [Longimicrobiaceae bacterium]|nr:prepilin-type N-terminal cleavage/methylation domain-containing protein [Longimicrobiaceae bacterium]
MQPTRSSRAGFTLIELMIVVVIIGILAAIAIPKFSSVSQSAKEAEAPPMLKQILTLESRYYQKNDSYATDVNALEGGSTLSSDSRYYTFGTTTHATGVCIVATPNTAGTAAGVRNQSMDANGKMYVTADCT